MESIFCRFISENECSKFMSASDLKYARSITSGCRIDYLNVNNNDDIECLLWNPKWRIAPSVCFKDEFPVFLTCRSHDNGCKKHYLHPSQSPFGTLPSKLSDQIAAAVVVPRTLRPTKAHKYSHSFNMQEMRCQFNGVDTLSITDRPLFNSDSILNVLYESLAIKNREDVRCHVANLSKMNVNIPTDVSLSLLHRASDIIPNNSYFDEYNGGGTFMNVKDAINLQKEMKKGTSQTIKLTNRNGDDCEYHFTPKWPLSILYVHPAGRYGAQFYCTPKPSLDHKIDTRILWVLQNLHTCVAEIWDNSVNNVTTTNQWYGWILQYTTECCFPHLLKRNSRQNFFSWKKNTSKYDKERQVLQKMNFILKDENNNENNNTTTELQVEVSNDNSISDGSENSLSGFNGSNASDLEGEFSSDDDDGHISEVSFSNITNFRNEDYAAIGMHNNNNVDASDVGMLDIDLDEVVIHNEIRLTVTENSNRNLEEIDIENVPESYKLFSSQYIKYLFKDIKTITAIDNRTDWRGITSDLNINVMLCLNTSPIANRIENVSHDEQRLEYIFNFIPIDLSNNQDWEVRCLCFSKESMHENINRWIGNIYCRHGGESFKNWWYLCSERPISTKMSNDFGIWNVDENLNGKCIIAVFVRKSAKELKTYRDTFLDTIGGQSKFICKSHQTPLVVTPAVTKLHCCYLNRNNGCKRKRMYANCPVQGCVTSICSFHFKDAKSNSGSIIELSPQSLKSLFDPVKLSYDKTFEELDVDKDNFFIEPQFGCEYDYSSCDDSVSVGSECSESSEISNSDTSMKHEETVERQLQSGQSSDNLEDNLEESERKKETCDHNPFRIPCSSAGAGGGLYLSEETKQSFVGAHVILNNCGMLLARRGAKLKGSKIQQRFMQCIVAKTDGKSVPLLYPEALLFPSIFWKENKFDAAPIGAIPCCLLAQDSTLSSNGFASLLDHFRSRITNPSLLTSTDYRYIAFCFDNFLNLQSRHTHTRLILHRGLWNSGLGRSIVSSRESLFDVDSIEKRPIVNKLAAAVAQKQATYFYTHTCNQQEHFGVRKLKKWIDSDELESLIMSKVGGINGLTSHIERYRDELKGSIVQSSAVVMLRNWMEVSSIWMNYIKNSKERPLGEVKRIWWRHEYQDTKGNLSHIHALIWIDENEMQQTTLNRIRGSTLDLITDNEVDLLLKEKIFNNPNDKQNVQNIASRILRHVCSERCKRRTGPNKHDLKCKVTNNGVENPTPNHHYFKEFDVDYSKMCINILTELGLMVYDNNTKNYIIHEQLRAVKHFPPAVGGEGNISPCNGKLFAACLSNNNLKYVTSYLASRYLAKYVAAIDENNRVYLSSNPTDAHEIKGKMEFLYNTKITSSAINEEKKQEKSKYRKKPQGRAISLMEIIATLLGYPQVYTDFKFIHVPTTPLAERSAIEKVAPIKLTMKESSFSRNPKIDDFDSADILPQYYIRNIKLQVHLDIWRQYTEFETLQMKDQMFSNLSVDNVTLFGMRPPELRFIRHIKLYFKWFTFERLSTLQKTYSAQVAFLETVIKPNFHDTMWIDGVGRKVILLPKAIIDIMEYIRTREESDFFGMGQRETIEQNGASSIDNQAKSIVLRLFDIIKTILTIRHDASNEIPECYSRIADMYLNVTDMKQLREKMNDELPIVWFSSIKPSHGTRWLLHLLISMGEFENEYSLYCQCGMRQCFVSCKLLSNNYDEHHEDMKKLARQYILEQLNFIPGGSKQFDRNVTAAYQTLKNLLILDTPIAMEMSPVLYTQLQESVDSECKKYLYSIKHRLLDTTIKKMSSKVSVELPLLQELMNCTKECPMSWNPLDKISCGKTQSQDSYKEQNNLLLYGCNHLKLFLSGALSWNQNLIICGGPGVGKTTLLQVLITYAASIGLNVNMSSVMSERSIELGGIHLSKMFCIPTDKMKSPSMISEKAVCTLLRNPKQFSLLQKMEVLAIDEFGQVSAELLSVLDIILRTIRKNSLFMGGVYIIATMDNMQLPPVNGRPPLLSPHMLSSFTFKLLTCSVRASQDESLQEIQKITRMNYNELQPMHLERFEYLIKENCSFVNDFNNPIITTDKLRIFGKRRAKVIAEETLLALKRKEYNGTLIECKAEDFESTLESQWDVASSTTSRVLSQRVKEPSLLCFYPHAIYEITFNNGSSFSQGQIAILAKMPTADEVKNFSPVTIYVAPDGCKTVPSRVNVLNLLTEGWRIEQMTKCREHTEFLGPRVFAKRRQYGLRHRIASTIHAAMGQDLQYVVTKVTNTLEDSDYNLWDKEQVVVLLSRTNFAKNIIFVGDRIATSKALSALLKKRSQYTEYTNLMLTTLSNTASESRLLSSMNLDLFPFRTIDFEIPTNSSGYVYLLQSRNPLMNFQTYIGETKNLVCRVRQHNQLRGSNSTRNPLLLPLALICFITGFSGSTSSTSRKSIEQQWKIERDRMKIRYNRPLTIEEVINIARTMIQQRHDEDLRLIICCSFN